MQNVFTKAGEFVAHVKEYVDNRVSAVKLQAAERSSKVASDLSAIAIVAAIMMVFVIFLSMAAAFALGEWLREMYLGFLVVAGVWLLIAILVWVSRESLLRLPIMNKMLKQMFRDDEDS